MPPPLTQKMLVDWAGREVLRDAQTLLDRGLVLEAHYEYPRLHGAILFNNRPLRTSLYIQTESLVENHCPCYMNRERGLICPHIIAVGLTVVRRNTDPLREAKYQEELRRASRLAEVDESQYITRTTSDSPDAMSARLKLKLDDNWREGFENDRVLIHAYLSYRDREIPLSEVPRSLTFRLSKQDESLLFVLEDIAEGPPGNSIQMNRMDFLNVVRLMSGDSFDSPAEEPIAVERIPLTSFLRIDLNRVTGQLQLSVHTEIPFETGEAPPLYCVAGREGWLCGGGRFWPLEKLLPGPYQSLYDEAVTVERTDVLRFFRQEVPLLAKHLRIESDIAEDLFTIEPAAPRFRLQVQGSRASLSATLYARYDELELVANKPDAREHFSIPNPDDLLGYRVRNPVAERAALELGASAGLRGQCGDDLSDIVGTREVLNFLGGWLPELRRRGWRVDMEGKLADFVEAVDFITPVVHVHEQSGADWFEVGFDFECTDGASISPAEIQRAIQMGEAFIERNGRTILLDSQAVDSMQNVFADCSTGDGSEAGLFRMSNIYAPFVKSSLDALDGIDVEDTAAWRQQAEQQNRTRRLTPAPVSEHLQKILRPYQRDGVNWLYFLEENGFCGLLADEMGLGKTLQTLAWLLLPRHRGDDDHQPSLIVCPTSLVENWAEEAERFAPTLRVLQMTGPNRHALWDEIGETDVIVTSYALLRRDLDRYVEIEFSAAILDEAQHIKNRATQNALSAKQIRARQRLVLTGTPVENSVSDLWSIMDYLMPGYLGGHSAFRQNYEQPISRGGPEAQLAQTKLRRKLHPFLLRRLKTEVARDLPPKIQKISYCHLTSDQRAVYAELLKQSQKKISNMVAEKGFARSRMEVLTTLMRLRQVCCHLDLLKLPDLAPDEPSGKLDLFLELVDEAVDSGHRILVFSQFVSMLHILRDELLRRKLGFCYLDGSTKNRMDEVHRFNSQRDIPLFLISLKAGGTGLNLTGADMVVHFDPWWNPAVEDQATDRAYRIGQKRTVYSHKLITRGTVEEKVLELQRRKKAVIDATVETDAKMVESLSWNDVQELLSL